ncbi:hypothetical protein FACS1894107_10390 [Planctomycetales bacterium]|nr:hypothetical protein FACS1894107_10390 [Planctomycetales bacterium]GHS97999.1 hypothetical protein FACS1894108_05350 [Planctomycetales bacterium]
MSATTYVPATPEMVWALLRENAAQLEKLRERQEDAAREFRERQEERTREFDREMRESRERQEKFDREMRESRERQEKDAREFREYQKETARQMKETRKEFGHFKNRFGELVEELLSPSMKKRFRAIGYKFTKVSSRIEIGENPVLAEIDVLLENQEYSMAVEVKSYPNIDDVNAHVERLQVLRKYADEHGDRHKFLGAVAGAVMADNVRKYAMKTGFFVLEQSGETVRLAKTPADFKPRVW